MLSTLLLVTAAFANPGDPDLLAARSEAADVLRFTLSGLPSDADDELRLSRLIVAGRAAAEVLGEGAVAAELDQSLRDARWRDAARDRSAAPLLEATFRRVLADLDFEPVMEADLPEGFPAPTPVGEIELKRYPVYRIARSDSGDNGAFWQLFQHIKKHDIPMTAPVEMTYDATGDAVDMAFMYEHPAQGEAGSDGPVEVVDIPPMLVVSLGCRGWSSEPAMARAYLELSAWIRDRGDLEIVGPTRRFGYNGPSVRGDRRYFEVQVPVRETTDDQAAEVVVDFAATGEPRRWRPVDDSVMGGVSASRLLSSGEGSCLFRGELSLENNGGFASVRSVDVDLDLEGARGLALKVRGDGKTYKLRLRMDGRFDGVSYEVRFPTTAGEWTESRFDFADFEPTWRGRAVPTAPELDPARVRSLGFMISDKQEGAFCLELATLSKA